MLATVYMYEKPFPEHKHVLIVLLCKKEKEKLPLQAGMLLTPTNSNVGSLRTLTRKGEPLLFRLYMVV